MTSTARCDVDTSEVQGMGQPGNPMADYEQQSPTHGKSIHANNDEGLHTTSDGSISRLEPENAPSAMPRYPSFTEIPAPLTASSLPNCQSCQKQIKPVEARIEVATSLPKSSLLRILHLYQLLTLSTPGRYHRHDMTTPLNHKRSDIKPGPVGRT